jgi:hypothetical protein
VFVFFVLLGESPTYFIHIHLFSQSKIGSQKDEIKELESLCGYLEGQMCGNGSDGPPQLKR